MQCFDDNSDDKATLPPGPGPGAWIEPWLGALSDNPDGWFGNDQLSNLDADSSVACSNSLPPPFLVERCCAQFIVSSTVVRRRPRQFYESALAQINAHVADEDSTRGRSSRAWGLLFEWIWHVIFDQVSPHRKKCTILCFKYSENDKSKHFDLFFSHVL